VYRCTTECGSEAILFKFNIINRCLHCRETRQQRFATADDDTAEPQGGHISGIVLRCGESQPIGNRWPIIVLCRGAVATAPVAAAINEQAGPTAFATAAAAGREVVAIHLGTGIAETGALIQTQQQFFTLCIGCSQLFRACKGQ